MNQTTSITLPAGLDHLEDRDCLTVDLVAAGISQDNFEIEATPTAITLSYLTSDYQTIRGVLIDWEIASA